MVRRVVEAAPRPHLRRVLLRCRVPPQPLGQVAALRPRRTPPGVSKQVCSGDAACFKCPRPSVTFCFGSFPLCIFYGLQY